MHESYPDIISGFANFKVRNRPPASPNKEEAQIPIKSYD